MKMDAFENEFARSELEYALSLPVDEASELRKDLLSQGVPDNQIVFVQPDDAVGVEKEKQRHQKHSRRCSESKRTETEFEEDDLNRTSERSSIDVDTTTVVVVRSSSSSDDNNSSCGDDVKDTANGAGDKNDATGDGESNHHHHREPPVSGGPECRCRSAVCETHKVKLRQLIVDYQKANHLKVDDVSDNGENDQIKCCYKQLVDMLMKYLPNQSSHARDDHVKEAVRAQPFVGESGDGEDNNNDNNNNEVARVTTDADSAANGRLPSCTENDDTCGGDTCGGDCSSDGNKNAMSRSDETKPVERRGRDDAGVARQWDDAVTPKNRDEQQTRRDYNIDDDLNDIGLINVEDSEFGGNDLHTTKASQTDPKILSYNQPKSVEGLNMDQKIKEKNLFRKIWKMNSDTSEKSIKQDHGKFLSTATEDSEFNNKPKKKKRELVSLKKIQSC